MLGKIGNVWKSQKSWFSIFWLRRSHEISGWDDKEDFV